jgi:Ca-activated chloride channel family protein
MSFGYPLILVALALLLPVAHLIWVWKRNDRRLVLPFDHGQPGGGWVWRMLLGCAESVPALILAVVILILGGPQRYDEPKTKRALTNIELLVDVSGSMTTPFGDGSRYDTSMKAIDQFLDYRKGDAVGLTFFGNNFLHWVPLTTDVSAIRCAPPFMRPENAPPWLGGTLIGKALRGCKTVLAERTEGDRMIVMVTDGDSYDLDDGNDLIIAKEMKDANIVVYSIHVSDEAVPAQISNITALTGGEVFAPDDPDGLKAVFKKIDQMQQAKLEKTLAEAKDFFAPFCIAGLALVGLAVATLFGLRYTPW